MASLNSRQECPPAEALHTSQDVKSFRARRASLLRKSSTWVLASWNVRTLLDVDGSIETGRQRDDIQVVDERKIDQVVDVLGRYKVDVAALQETKWFGENKYTVDKCVVLAAGRSVPGPGIAKQRGEGVAIVLSGPAVGAWKDGGCRWKAWSSRLVTATLKVEQGGGAEFLHVFSCYAPTYVASREDKDSFFDTLQQAISAVPSEECFVMLGDFNARVGSRADQDDDWWYERGPHGHGVINEAGRELLSFLSINDATVCNTWFPKKAIHKQTWQHPKSKQWHCIDYAIMRKSHRRRCMDVTVMRGAQCNTDHMMLKMKLQFGKKNYKSRGSGRLMKRYDVLKLQGRSMDDKGRTTTRGKFENEVCERIQKEWKSDGTVEEKWNVMKTALCETASSVLGTACKRQADWFRESDDDLRPLIEERNRLHASWLNTGSDRDKRKFVKARTKARQAIREAKNAWFQVKALEAERRRNNGKGVWKCIRDMQRGRKGLIPTRTAVVKDENGNSCSTPELQQQRWRRHFSNVLNLQSEFSVEELERVRQRPMRPEMGDPPSEEELQNALGKLKCGKASGETGILPEMLKTACGTAEFMKRLLELVSDVWRECKVPTDWCDAVLVPIPKKGDLSSCDNWRGIALLDVVGKVAARVLQERLQKIAEDELPESQCGFRKGRGCTDMIFTIRQLVEKSWEHTAKSFFTFIDLKKAYDSVPREALWLALQKLGVPAEVVQLTRSFHQGMKAKILLDGSLLEQIDVQNGLRQGCCMAPVLFNLFSSLVIERWQARVEGAEGVGIKLNFKYDQKLFRRYIRNASVRTITECLFADDGALLASTRSGAERAVREYQGTCSDFGLTVSNPTYHYV